MTSNEYLDQRVPQILQEAADKADEIVTAGADPDVVLACQLRYLAVRLAHAERSATGGFLRPSAET